MTILQQAKTTIFFTTFTFFAACGGRTLPQIEEDMTSSTTDGGLVGQEAGAPLGDGSIRKDAQPIPAGQVTITLNTTTAGIQGMVKGTVHNKTTKSIFLAGCGIFDRQHFENGLWVSKYSALDCTWEGNAIEVAAGATYSQSDFFPLVGIWRLALDYGVGCSPQKPLDLASCASSGKAYSVSIKIQATKSYCDTLLKSYQLALQYAKACDLSQPKPQCTFIVSENPLCSCQVYVNTPSSLYSLVQNWSLAGCSALYSPCGIKCAAPTPLSCINSVCQ